ncbi:CmlA/FloR family chloramphenicol efflux MFS transporter [Ensifer adhaerens]|uniref:CmlA/FloR family chloramphenicol efflux MFS transporter n=1 Tax=Ensifer adhaerens TaxID=106592 RepID=UPI001CBB45FC|nr:CmlA/FloR family chloramphenicol efflux MFS transporter [Ensifer adhaerens]MBZ7923932.1 CmlA/FloR family chloramphenicol efflux MFS transporter [Ensifer adhaerens]UAX92468.1 CmlA/FloR family chloramphenicol efflux MFS transporter [Ensifer adhaerens]UAY00103.1 CmlA/FloR family chloramphenicol efflux MFS transporter [Ensifer adhaerens]UAY07486.1 CmlA/FloR family chloramphenicol efflux MFS transporter [Ensifer adhaerens]
MPDHNSPTWSYSLPAALLLMAPFDILASLAMDIYLPVVPEMPGILGTSPAIVQLTLSLYMLLLGVGQILVGPLSDRFGRRPVLLGGATLFALSSLGLAATSSAPAFVALRLVQAAGASAALVATFATVRDVYGARPEGVTIYGLFSAMLSFVPALGPIAGALIAGTFGWRAIFLTLGVLGLAALGQALLRWSETRPAQSSNVMPSFAPVLRSGAFWTYTLGFSTAMGAFFVFFSTAPRLLIDRAGYSQFGFSLAFATAAVVMIITTRFAKGFVERYGIPGCLARGMGLIMLGGLLLAVGEVLATPSFVSFVLPMWVIAVGIVMSASVSANGALKAFDAVAGTAVALYFCVQSLIVGLVGTGAVLLLRGDTAWPLVGYCLVMATITQFAMACLNRRERH